MAILIVDDSTDHYALLRSILTKAGHDQILGAESAQTAFSMLNLDGTQSATDVDLILMDVLMPEIDGAGLPTNQTTDSSSRHSNHHGHGQERP